MATSSTANPLLQDWTAPYGLPPFAEVKAEQFAPAFDAALSEHRSELDAIAGQQALPSFENTMAAFDRSGRLLVRLEGLFHNLAASETSPALQAVQRELAAPLAAHNNAVYMHAGLFARVDALYQQRDQQDLTPEQLRLLERVHLDFVRAGAKLTGAAQARYAQIMERLAELTTQFGQNVLADETGYRLVLRSDAELAGLPDFVRAAAKQAAVGRGVSDAHVITLSRSLIVPFLTFSERRDLREQAWKAWVSRGEHAGANDNREVAREILTLRNEQARLHGHSCFADYALADTMAGTRDAVSDLLQRVWEPAKAAVQLEHEALQACVLSRGEALTLEAWDWRFYAEKVRQARYDLDEAQIKPYFPLTNMVEAVFDVANRLFGLRFVAKPDIKAYHPDVQVYEVQGVDGKLRGVFLHDNFARPTKRSGAWMSSFRVQSNVGPKAACGDRPPRGASSSWDGPATMTGGAVLPIVVNNNNFAKGAPGAPCLLSFDDARTLFHEFGHGLHGLLSQVEFERLSGTQVLRDFVELPSQLFEHWLSEPEILKKHARHYQTGEVIPQQLVDKLKAAELFNQGFETVRYTASALVDMAAHSLTDAQGPDITAFETQVLQDAGLPSAVGLNHRLAHFQHLFSGSSYAAGYYVYLWAEVLEADGFDAFVEAGDPFDAQVAKRLLECIYSSGNSREPRAAFRAFRGRDAQVEPMLKGRGLLPLTC